MFGNFVRGPHQSGCYPMRLHRCSTEPTRFVTFLLEGCGIDACIGLVNQSNISAYSLLLSRKAPKRPRVGLWRRAWPASIFGRSRESITANCNPANNHACEHLRHFYSIKLLPKLTFCIHKNNEIWPQPLPIPDRRLDTFLYRLQRPEKTLQMEDKTRY